ncbi:cell division protein ZapA [Marinobacterium nitratireducens]|uniref:Cell division protein ZapA n=1 Tax=Marinobacterium nitratireducens TaxID=518897 RepID=A0A917ZNY7_9GAMM|nr:cell division protein ZapA [Marinobacterium nitratireducens]GGO87747.1 cell division protein ZapA [Marinobacterium nitratireducens]
MSKSEQQKVSIRLLDKEYVIACPDGAEAELIASADYLDQKMRDIRGNGKTVGLERIAVMAGLNIAHELLKSREDSRENIESQIRRLGNKIDSSLKARQRPAPEPGD